MAKVKLNIPNKMSEVKFGQYQKFHKLMTKDSDVDFVNKKMIEIFCGLPLLEVDKIKYESIADIIEILTKMFNEKPNLIKKFEMDGVEYGFHPQLSEMTFGEFVDLDTFAGDWDTMDKALGVLFRPIKDNFRDTYLIEDYDGAKETHMKEMPLDVALGAIFFLSNLRIELMNAILAYSKKELSRTIQHQNKDFPISGAGMLPSFLLAKEKLQNMKKSRN